MSRQQKNPGQTPFAGVEELIDEIRFVADVAVQQVGDEQLRDALLIVEHSCHNGFAILVTADASIAVPVAIPNG